MPFIEAIKSTAIVMATLTIYSKDKLLWFAAADVSFFFSLIDA